MEVVASIIAEIPQILCSSINMQWYKNEVVQLCSVQICSSINMQWNKKAAV